VFENFRRKLKKVHIQPQDSEEEKNEGPKTLRGVLSATKNIHYLYVYIYITAYTHNHPSPTHFRIYNTYPPLDYYWCFKNRLRRTERIIVLQISDHTPLKMRRIYIYREVFFSFPPFADHLTTTNTTVATAINCEHFLNLFPSFSGGYVGWRVVTPRRWNADCKRRGENHRKFADGSRGG